MQFLHAFFLRGPLGLTGSHVGTGRSRSAGVNSDSASIEGVDGELSAQSAFFDDLRPGSILRRGNAMAVGALVGVTNDAPEDCAGF